jgi:alkylation response protein AidB-like acyl-CoA dehydrogenase
MHFDWSDEELAFRHRLRELLEETLPAEWPIISRDGPGSDAQVEFARTFCPQLAERGWLTPHWPRQHGGLGLSAWHHALLSEEMWAVGEPRGPQYMNVNWVGPSILQFGTPEQIDRFVPPITAGAAFWCQGFSEPDAGSDLVALRTRAARDGDTYVINGQKVWTSYANHAEFCFLLARTGAAGRAGISVFLLPMDTPGVELREIPSVVGSHYFHEIFLTDVVVAADARLGPEGDGWKIVNFALSQERVGSARYARAERLLNDIANSDNGRARLADPALAARFGAARAACSAARLLAYKVVDQRNRSEPPSPDVNIARVANTRADQLVADLALDVYGPAALEYGSATEASFRMALTAGIAVGTTEIQLNLIARRFLGLS